ncbi:kynureninase [Sphingomonas segetis]|jgi:kynureninase|uniref:kynureninase n=1 Tax=Sphingomonas segetis TaxID=1104779 RepID=UPI0012D2E4E7|nr:kynureninase [Sphingomonas segetis]
MTLDEARQLDASDPLAFARERFSLPEGVIYLDGNSLGALPKAAPAALAEAAERQWGEDLISSWNKHEWIDWPTTIAAKLSPVVGAKPNQLLIADSTSVCLFKLLAAAVRARPGRGTIVTQQANFPTDLYVAQGLADMLGLEVKAVPSGQVSGALDDDTAVVMLTHVDYRSAAVHDMRAINDAAHAAGALAVWDLSHSAGAIELDLDGSGCDLAVGCGYKYLNGGPGSPAFIYVADGLQGELANPLQGWMGHAEPFAFVDDYRPNQGIVRFLTGTPSILAMAALEAGLGTFDGIAMGDVQAKSRKLSRLFVDEVEARCGSEVRLASPRDPAQRGSHIVFAHAEGYAVMQALIARGVIGDFRAPNLMRFGFTPLYTRYPDVVRAAEILTEILEAREWDQPRFRARAKVT